MNEFVYVNESEVYLYVEVTYILSNRIIRLYQLLKFPNY